MKRFILIQKAIKNEVESKTFDWRYGKDSAMQT